ncbi:MAG: hypothetical protein MI717_05180 [Spirochaetales bacterium]|nr:hypothetical protein [Spirochaetales bacterium]
MSTELERASAFVGRLWENPTLSGLSPLQREEQLIQFLEINNSTLLPTLTSPAFFPNQSWHKIRTLLLQALSNRTNTALSPLFDAVLQRKINFHFVANLEPKRAPHPDRVRKSMAQFLRTLASRPDSRSELTGPLMGVGTGLIDKYIGRIFERQRYIGFELRKVQRLKLEAPDVADLVKATMLIRPAILYFSPDEGGGGHARNVEHVSPAFAAKAASSVAQALPLMPADVVSAATHSALSFQDNPHLECSSRLAAVFAHRCRHMRPGMRVDRGAESSDKSWFSVARKNYKFYGFDLDMLVELHSIATENGW